MACTWRKVLRPRRRSSRANHLQELERPQVLALACGESKLLIAIIEVINSSSGQ